MWKVDEMKKFKTLTLEISTHCQADCLVCVRDKLNFKLGSMPQNLFEKAIREVSELYISKGGGFCNILIWAEWENHYWTLK